MNRYALLPWIKPIAMSQQATSLYLWMISRPSTIVLIVLLSKRISVIKPKSKIMKKIHFLMVDGPAHNAKTTISRVATSATDAKSRWQTKTSRASHIICLNLSQIRKLWLKMLRKKFSLKRKKSVQNSMTGNVFNARTWTIPSDSPAIAAETMHQTCSRLTMHQSKKM